MGTESVEQEIRALESRLEAEGDPHGRAFAPLADAYRRAGRHDEAAAVLKEGLSRHPGAATGHVVAGLLHWDMGNSEEAERSLQRVLELDDENVVALEVLAELALEAGSRDRARDLFHRVRALDAFHPTAEDRIRELEASGSPDPGADPTLQEDAVRGDSGDGRRADAPPGDAADGGAPDGEDTEVYTRTMAELYASQGLTDRALKVFRRLAREDPDDPELQRKIEELSGADRTAEDGPSDSEDEEDLRFPASEADPGRAQVTLDDVAPGEDPGPSALSGHRPMRGTEAPDRVRSFPPAAEDPRESAPQWAGDEDEADLGDPAPFPWGPEEDEAQEPDGALTAGPSETGPPVSRYFEVLLSWVPGAVPVEELAPDDAGGEAEEPGATETEELGATRPEEPAATEPEAVDPALHDPEGPARGESYEGDEDDEDFEEWLRSLKP